MDASLNAYEGLLTSIESEGLASHVYPLPCELLGGVRVVVVGTADMAAMLVSRPVSKGAAWSALAMRLTRSGRHTDQLVGQE